MSLDFWFSRDDCFLLRPSSYSKEVVLQLRLLVFSLSPPSLSCLFFGGYTTLLVGADPSSHVAYASGRCTCPPPSEAEGRRRARPVGPGLNVSGYFVASLCLAEGHRDPGTLFGRERALSLPPQVPFSHALVSFFRPRLFFCFFCSSSAFEAPTG